MQVEIIPVHSRKFGDSIEVRISLSSGIDFFLVETEGKNLRIVYDNVYPMDVFSSNGEILIVPPKIEESPE